MHVLILERDRKTPMPLTLTASGVGVMVVNRKISTKPQACGTYGRNLAFVAVEYQDVKLATIAMTG